MTPLDQLLRIVFAWVEVPHVGDHDTEECQACLDLRAAVQQYRAASPDA